jgi:hypothetical protein
MTGQEVPRQTPARDSLNIPEILDQGIMQKVHDYHNEYDSYEIPDQINVVEVAGWGRPTIKEILYTTGNEGTDDYNPVFTYEGDKTVVYPSALSSEEDKQYYYNLFLYSNSEGKKLAHKDLLNIPDIQMLISSIVKEMPNDESDLLTLDKPNVSNIADQLIVSAHSPVALGVYDTEGNFTGIDAQGENISEEIPESSVNIVGQSQYIFLPKEGVYNFSYSGTGNGPTTIKIEDFSNDITMPLVVFSDIPTTLQTKASFELDSTELERTHIDVDENGDGTVDLAVLPDQAEPQPDPELSRSELLALLQSTVERSGMNKGVKKQLLAKIKILQKALTSRSKILQKVVGIVDIEIMEKEIVQLKKKKKLSEEISEELLSLLDNIKNKI